MDVFFSFFLFRMNCKINFYESLMHSKKIYIYKNYIKNIIFNQKKFFIIFFFLEKNKHKKIRKYKSYTIRLILYFYLSELFFKTKRNPNKLIDRKDEKFNWTKFYKKNKPITNLSGEYFYKNQKCLEIQYSEKQIKEKIKKNLLNIFYFKKQSTTKYAGFENLKNMVFGKTKNQNQTIKLVNDIFLGLKFLFYKRSEL